MARTATIHFERVTLSLPKALVEKLRATIPKNKRSEYVAKLITEDLGEEEEEDNLIEELRKIREESVKYYKTDKSSLEILREIRYGES